MEQAVPVQIPGIRWSAGSPEPLLIASERRTLFAFYKGDDEVEQDDEVQAAEFVGCTSVRFGFPNDEPLQGHPLWGHGLAFYSVHEVEESSWVAALRENESAHPAAPALPFANAKHFVLTFHDSTLEAVARGIVALNTFASMEEAASALAAGLNGE
jgi:hypothetical protein